MTRTRLELIDAYCGSLYHTAKYLLGYSEINRRTHQAAIDCLEDGTRRKLLCLPRGTFKSSIGCVSFPIWLLLRNPNLRILIDSEVYENSKNFIREIRGKLELPAMTELFGPFRSSHWTEGSITIAQRYKVLKEASITASGVGAGKTGQHYDVIIHDDLNSDKNSENPEQRKKVIRHFQMNTSILEPNGLIVLIGTRYAADDVIGHVLENECRGLLPSD